MQPLNSQILIEYKEEIEKKTSSGVYIPPAAENNAIGFLRSGKVLEINKKEKEEGEIKVGDTVLFNKNAICYIPAEKELRLTRRCLEVIERHNFGVTVHTKSDLLFKFGYKVPSIPSALGVSLSPLSALF